MKKKLPSFLAGFLSAILLFVIPAAYAANTWTKTIEVGIINVLVNGKEFHPTDPNGKPVDIFVYNGTTYAPLRALAEAYGLTVGYDREKNLATVSSPESQPSPSQTGSKPTSIALDRQYVYIGEGETVELKVESTPKNSKSTVSWISSDPEYFQVINGKVSIVKAGGSFCTITAKTDNGLFATCYVMMKTNDITTEKVGNKLVYSLFPSILSFENVSPDTALWTHFELDLKQFGIYEHSYDYLVNTPEKATDLARTYAYWLRSQGYTLVREEDDPVVNQPAGIDDTIYELRAPSNSYLIKIKGDSWGPGGPTVTVGIDYSDSLKVSSQTPTSSRIKYYTAYPDVPDFGAMFNISPSIEYPKQGATMFYYDSLYLTSNCIYEYVDKLRFCGFDYIGSFENTDGGTVLCYSNGHTDISVGSTWLDREYLSIMVSR